MKTLYSSTLALFVGAASLSAQGIGDRIADAPDGKIRMSFEAREGVCGNGHRFQIRDDDEDFEWQCDPGPVRVSLRLRGGVVVDVSTYVGGEWRPSRRVSLDLGEVDPALAADYLLQIAGLPETQDADEAIYAAAIAANVVVWPRLLEYARDRNLREDVRSQAIFWLGQEAVHEATDGLVEILDDDDEEIQVRQQAVFAISQKTGQGIPILIRVALTNPHPQLRENALFWLAESEDPRAIDLFEEILSAR